jgi:hypothetical protein
MAENSDLGSAFQPTPADPPGYGQKLSSYLGHGAFYAYGLGSGLNYVHQMSIAAKSTVARKYLASLS